MYFYERPDCITLSSNVDPYGLPSGIFLFKNFIPEELMLDMEKEIESHGEYRETSTYNSTLISWYKNKMTPRPKRLLDFWELISELLYPTWVIHPSQSILNVRPGDGGMFCHSDSPGKGECHRLSQGDRYDTCCVLDYGLVAYFGNFTGGAVYYPMINPDGTPITNGVYGGKCFEYQPERGDLVIHSAFDPYAHGVREVESGIRYAFSNFVLKAEDNPGSFYNYKTEEYYKQIGSRSEEEVTRWMIPLIENPVFTDERIKIMQDSGLEGVDLSNKFEDQLRKQNA